MKKIMFNDKYGLTQAVLEGRKTMTRRVANAWERQDGTLSGWMPGAYKEGEEVAVAQKYIDLKDCDAFYECMHKDDPYMPLECIKGEKGAYNKMFVKAAWMPHRIKITNIKVERLQDISEEDALREGVQMFDTPEGKVYVAGGVYVGEDARLKIAKGMINLAKPFGTAREAFAVLIDKVSGKGTWESNPWVFVYEFELLNS